jgi:hypothetical protein
MGQLLATLRKSDNKRAAELFLDFESMWRGGASSCTVPRGYSFVVKVLAEHPHAILGQRVSRSLPQTIHNRILMAESVDAAQLASSYVCTVSVNMRFCMRTVQMPSPRRPRTMSTPRCVTLVVAG